mmetsp:Transcript_10335/g.28869  ORF Transcript_10335/g.28869 Transcript_10335/m.28869 type:complete len:226 (+) Transcript_10335:1038-1715(+)
MPPSGTRSPAPGESISRPPDRTTTASTVGHARRLSSAASRARTPPARPRPCAAASSSASPTRPSGTFAPNLRRRRGCAWSKPWINPRVCWDARVALKTAGRRIRCRTRAARTRCCRTWATRLTCTSGSGSFARRTNQPPAFRPRSPRSLTSARRPRARSRHMASRCPHPGMTPHGWTTGTRWTMTWTMRRRRRARFTWIGVGCGSCKRGSREPSRRLNFSAWASR